MSADRMAVRADEMNLTCNQLFRNDFHVPLVEIGQNGSKWEKIIKFLPSLEPIHIADFGDYS